MKPKAFVLLVLCGCSGASVSAAVPSADVRSLLASLPLHFESNEGQADPSVRFLARGAGYRVFLTDSEAVLALSPREGGTTEVLRWSLVGANLPRRLEGASPLPGRANYLTGADPAGWHTDVPLYARVRQAEVYPGIGLTYYGTARQLEYDLEVAPHADPRAIRFRIEGAQSLRLDRAGDLRIRTSHGELVQRAPLVYQTNRGLREPVKARFRRYGDREVGFEIAAYDRERALVIDPVVLWSVYLGSPGADAAKGVAVKDSAGIIDAYIVGTAAAGGFNPLAGTGVTPYVAKDDIFVTRLRLTSSPAALSVVYSTYIGGDGNDRGTGIAVGPQDNAYLCASTDSVSLPTSKTIGPGGQVDAYVARLNAAGNGLDYAVRIGGALDDLPNGIAVDANNVAYVVGETGSSDFPTAGGPLQGRKGNRNAFLSVLAADQTLTYSTYLGGNSDDRAMGVALDNQDINLVGITNSSDFPKKNPLQNKLGGGFDAFVARLTPGTPPTYNLVFSTFLGGTMDDQGLGIAADSSGVYVTGSTASGDFPVQGQLQGLKGTVNAFVSKLRPTGASLFFSTYLGGTGSDTGTGIGVDGKGYVYVTGETRSADFPVVRPILPGGERLQGASDAFLAKLIPTGCSLAYSTHFGGGADDAGAGVAVTPAGLALIAGRTVSTDLPVTPALGFPGSAAYQGGSSDAFAAMFNDDGSPDLAVSKTADVEPAVVNGFITWTITVRNVGTVGAHDISVVDMFPGSVLPILVQPGSNCSTGGVAVICSFSCLDAGGSLTVTITAKVFPSAVPQMTNSVRVSAPDDPNPANDTAQVVSTVVPPRVDLGVTKTGEPTVAVGDQIHYTMTITNNGPSTATGVVLKDTLPIGTTFVSSPVCPAPVGNLVTCPIADMASGSSTSAAITILATTAGVVTNKAQVSSTEFETNPANNTAFFTTMVTVPGNGAQFFTVRSSDAQNLLEWKNPPGPADGVSIHRTTAAPSCVFETNGAKKATEIAAPAFLANAYDSLVDPQPVTNGTTYCYSIFVRTGSTYSPPRFNRGRPFDSVTGRVRWEFNIGTASLAPIGNGLGMVHSVSNDGNLYAMVKGATTAGGGRWPQGPPQYLPFPMAGPSQGRPTSVPNRPGPPSRVTFLSSTDGTVYAIDAEHGSNGTLLWQSPVLGPMLTAPPSASFLQFGATRDLIYLGSRNAAGSQLYGLRLVDGQPLGPGWATNGGAFGRIGPVNGQAAVDYATHHVFFASRAFGPAPDNNTLWCVDFETGLPVWAQPYGDVDASLSLRGGRLYVATNAGTVLAVNATDGSLAWTFTIPAGEGPAKGYVATDARSQNLYFSTANRVFSLQDQGATVSDNWPTGGPFPPSPSTPVYAPLDTLVYIGAGDGRVYRLNVADGTTFDSFTLGAGDAAVGSPTLDLRANYLYVGTEAGRVYAVELP
jgi:uncharacterized repeat protein (TIGR01451 family)